MVKTGKWYRTADGREMRVLQIDADDGTVEIEYNDGDLDVIDFDTLISEIELYPVASPASGFEVTALDYVPDFDYDEGGHDHHTIHDVLDSMNY